MGSRVSETARRFRPRRAVRSGDRKSVPTKRATNVSIDADILRAARRMRINLSHTLEEALRAIVRDERNAQWRKENAETIKSYNRLIEKAGAFGEEFQEWNADRPDAR